MTIKQFLEPDWRKIVVFIILAIIFSLVDTGISGELIVPILGLPLPYYYSGGGGMLPNGSLFDSPPNFNFLDFSYSLYFILV